MYLCCYVSSGGTVLVLFVKRIYLSDSECEEIML